MSLLSSLNQALEKTRQIFTTAVNAKNIEELEAILLRADVGVTSTDYILSKIRSSKSESKNYRDVLFDILVNILQKPNYKMHSSKPAILMIIGTPGSGKTTTIAKLANLEQKNNKKVIIAASDTYRAAAAHQLEIWAKRTGTEIVFSQKGQDAGAVAFDTIQKAQSGKFDIVLIDTAGRLHTRKDLMDEAKKIKRVCQKFRSDAPDDIWLILDATVGQNGIEQAKIFHKELNLTGVVITKLDGTAKGGVIIPIALELGLPIRYLGLGETIEDLVEFEPNGFVKELLSG